MSERRNNMNGTPFLPVRSRNPSNPPYWRRVAEEMRRNGRFNTSERQATGMHVPLFGTVHRQTISILQVPDINGHGRRGISLGNYPTSVAEPVPVNHGHGRGLSLGDFLSNFSEHVLADCHGRDRGLGDYPTNVAEPIHGDGHGHGRGSGRGHDNQNRGRSLQSDTNSNSVPEPNGRIVMALAATGFRMPQNRTTQRNIARRANLLGRVPQNGPALDVEHITTTRRGSCSGPRIRRKTTTKKRGQPSKRVGKNSTVVDVEPTIGSESRDGPIRLNGQPNIVEPSSDENHQSTMQPPPAVVIRTNESGYIVAEFESHSPVTMQPTVRPPKSQIPSVLSPQSAPSPATRKNESISSVSPLQSIPLLVPPNYDEVIRCYNNKNKEQMNMNGMEGASGVMESNASLPPRNNINYIQKTKNVIPRTKLIGKANPIAKAVEKDDTIFGDLEDLQFVDSNIQPSIFDFDFDPPIDFPLADLDHACKTTNIGGPSSLTPTDLASTSNTTDHAGIRSGVDATMADGGDDDDDFFKDLDSFNPLDFF